MNCDECRERLYPENPEIGYTDFRTGRYFPPLCQGCPQSQSPEEMITRLEDRVDNLEAISAEAGRIPRRYYNQFQQMHGELAYLRNRIDELSGKPVKKSKLAEGVRL